MKSNNTAKNNKFEFDNSGERIDKRFPDYMQLYNSLDKLIWTVPSFLLGATIIGAGLGASKNSYLIGYEWAGLLVLAVFYFLGAFSLFRLRQHHTLVGDFLAEMEPDGYFNKRAQTIQRPWKSAPNWFILVFFLLGCISFICAGISIIKTQNEEKIMNVSTIVEDFGIKFITKKMENGEFRAKVSGNDGSAYIRTEASKSSGWQNSHFHKTAIETYIVQKGWVVLSELLNGKLSIKKHTEGSIFSTKPNLAHNIYMPGGAIIHTIKHGDITPKDWHDSNELDSLTKKLTELEILKSAK